MFPWMGDQIISMPLPPQDKEKLGDTSSPPPHASSGAWTHDRHRPSYRDNSCTASSNFTPGYSKVHVWLFCFGEGCATWGQTSPACYKNKKNI